jgi:hypothetical protein
MSKSNARITFSDEQMFKLKLILKGSKRKSTVQSVIDYALQLTENAHSTLDDETLEIILPVRGENNKEI